VHLSVTPKRAESCAQRKSCYLSHHESSGHSLQLPTHIAALRKRPADTGAKLKQLYDAIEKGIADLADPMLKDRLAAVASLTKVITLRGICP
jgi:hypothetical protein